MELLIVFWAIMAIVCAVVGNSKGRSGTAYFFGGLLCWPVALTMAIVAKQRQPPTPTVAPTDAPAPAKATPTHQASFSSLTDEEKERYDEMVREGIKPADALRYIALEIRAQKQKQANASKSLLAPIARVYAGDATSASELADVYAGHS